MIDPEAERAWVLGARAGSADAFARLVGAHQGGLRAFLRRLCGNHAEADDIAQESFVAAWEGLPRFDPERNFRTWLFGVAWRKHRGFRRSAARLVRRERIAMETAGAAAEPDPGLRLDLAAALGALPAGQRASVILCLAEGFSHEEAAEALGLPLGTLKSHVVRGREMLVTRLGDKS